MARNHDDDGPEDISLTKEEIAKIQKRKAKAAMENPSQTFAVECPDCGCDYIIPLMKAFFTKSFAGNRMQVIWPTREKVNDTALVACPQCFIVYRVNEDGTFVKLGKKLKFKKD
jgi:hypothetical protein